jgi:hypothetical protein
MFEETTQPANGDNNDNTLSNGQGDSPDHQEDRPAEESIIDGQSGDHEGHEGPPEPEFERFSERLGLLAQAYTNHTSRLESFVQIVAACQKQTAEFANHVLERHALHPAVETVDVLATLIGQLNEQANALVEAGTHCPMFEPLLDAIAEAAKMAQAKREYLDMQSLCPAPLDELNVDNHEIRQAVCTDDPDKHKRVERTLVPGLIYRGTVLRRAKVSVHRHVENEQPNRKDNP